MKRTHIAIVIILAAVLAGAVFNFKEGAPAISFFYQPFKHKYSEPGNSHCTLARSHSQNIKPDKLEEDIRWKNMADRNPRL